MISGSTVPWLGGDTGHSHSQIQSNRLIRVIRGNALPKYLKPHQKQSKRPDQPFSFYQLSLPAHDIAKDRQSEYKCQSHPFKQFVSSFDKVSEQTLRVFLVDFRE